MKCIIFSVIEFIFAQDIVQWKALDSSFQTFITKLYNLSVISITPASQIEHAQISEIEMDTKYEFIQRYTRKGTEFTFKVIASKIN